LVGAPVGARKLSRPDFLFFDDWLLMIAWLGQAYLFVIGD